VAAGTSTSDSGPLIEPNARPFHYKTTAQWLRAGLDRQKPAAIGALIAAWTGLAFALWFAVGGIVLGALVGSLGASSLGVAGTISVNTGTGVLGAIAGALVGAIAGFALIYVLLVLNPLQLAGALASGVLVSAIFLVIYVRIEPWLMRLRGYREPSKRERRRIHPLLLDAARRMDLVVVPEVWISDQQKPGAWAHMRAIVVTQGLLGDYDASEKPPQSELDDTALSAILAHELHHWESGDVVGLAVVTACFCPIVLIIDGIAWIRERGEWLGILLWVVFWPVWVASKLVVVPLMAKRSRQCEYDADARAASLGDPYRLGLRRALDELSAWERPRTGWEDVIAATHPPIEHRLERLEASWKPEPAVSARTTSAPLRASSPTEPTPTTSTPASRPQRAPRRTPQPTTDKRPWRERHADDSASVDPPARLRPPQPRPKPSNPNRPPPPDRPSR
jgi:Zn-dependent protease with chaperone function